MKKQFVAAAIGFASVGSLSAQSLFDFAPDIDDTSSFPLKWTAGVNIGYDDNPVPLSGDDDSSLYGQAYVGAKLLNNTPQTTTEFFGRIGVIHYFDSLDTPAGAPDAEETSFTAGLGLNIAHRFSERLRYVTNNYATYELEPDYTSGAFGARQTGSYLRYSTSHALGFRWTERLGTYTGVSYSVLEYDESRLADRLDRDVFTFFNDFRYQAGPQTVVTFTYRYSDVDANGLNSDSTRQYFLAGVEQRISDNTVFAIKAGIQSRDVDGGGGSETSPHVEANLRSRINEAFSVNAYVRFENDPYNRSIGADVYEGSETLRIGVKGSYRVSEQLTLNGGVNYADFSYEDPLDPADAEVDEDLINVHAGFGLRLSDGIFLNGNVNFSDFGSDAGRDYDRTRISLGVSAEF